jgi:hypothetical protein
MLPRWNCVLNNLKLFLRRLEILLSIKFKRSKRDRKPKHSIRSYFKLMIVKEYKNASLRDAECDFSKTVCRNRVDHSVIHYWEKKVSKEIIEKIVRLVAEEVEEQLGYDFSVIDSTKFSSWKKDEIEFHTLTRITKDTVYPSCVYFGTVSPSKVVSNVLIEGNKDLLCDAWYDENDSMGMMFKRGYTPYVSPNTGRWRGYWRHKARKLYMHPVGRQKYRKRGRGESTYGSMTDEFGDRLKTSRVDATITRIGARIITYLVKIYMRIDNNLILIKILVNC